MKGHSLFSENRSNWVRVPAGASHWGKYPTAGSALMAGLLARVLTPAADAKKDPQGTAGAEDSK